MSMLISILVLSVAVFVTGTVLSGITLKKWQTALVVAVVLAVLNAFIQPALQPLLSGVLLQLPLVTLGLVAFIVNVLFVLIAGAVVPDFKVKGLLWAVVFAFVLSLLTTLLESFI